MCHHEWFNEFSFFPAKKLGGVVIIISGVCLLCREPRKLKLLRKLGNDGWLTYEFLEPETEKPK